MQFFESAIFALIVFIPFFFLVFFYLCFAWSAMYKRKERLTIATVLSFSYSFKILAIGFFVLFLASLLLPILVNYIPILRKIIY
jgi:ABC-type multidrug transport system permease subunit